MRISDWSSYVCSSDLADQDRSVLPLLERARAGGLFHLRPPARRQGHQSRRRPRGAARKARAARRLIRVPQPIESASRSEEHTSELQSLMRNSYAVFCLKKKTKARISLTKPEQKRHKVRH